MRLTKEKNFKGGKKEDSKKIQKKTLIIPEC